MTFIGNEDDVPSYPPTTQWWGSTIATVKEPISGRPRSYPISLTSVFTLPPGCLDRWKISPLTTIDHVGFDRSGRPSNDFPLSYNHVAYTNIGGRPSPVTGSSSILPVYDRLDGTCMPEPYQRYYSPGVCPQSHTVAQMTAWLVTGSNSAVETHYIASCCRSGMSFTNIAQGDVQCVSEFHTSIRVLRLMSTSVTVMQSGSTLTANAIWDYTSGSQTFDNATTFTTGIVVADAIYVGWQKKDLSLFPTDFASSLAQSAGISWSSTSAPTPGSSPGLPPPTSTPPAQPSSSKISAGGKAGIGVGIAGFVLIGAIVLWLFVRRRKNKKKPDEAVAEEPFMPEMEDQDRDQATRKVFKAGNWRSELSAHEVPREIDGRTINVVPGPPVELPGSER